jgi:hypothetical protein
LTPVQTNSTGTFLAQNEVWSLGPNPDACDFSVNPRFFAC